MEDWPPLVLGFEVNEVLCVEEAGSIGPVVGTTNLAGDLSYLGERGEDNSRPVHDIDATGWSFAGSERAPHPDSAFVEVGEELRTQDAAEEEKGREGKDTARAGEDYQPMADGPAGCEAIAIGDPDKDGVVPLLRIPDEEEAGKNGRQHQRVHQGAEEGEGYCPGHWLEEPALNSLQCEDWQVG